MFLQNLKNWFVYSYWNIFVTLHVSRMYIDKAKETRTNSLWKSYLRTNIFFYNNKVYFGWSERTALIKNCSDRAYTLYTIHFTVYRMITPFWGKGGVDPGVTPPLGSGLSPREPMHLLILWLSLLRVLPYPLTLYLISDVEDIGIFYLEKWFILTINLIDSVSRNPQENFKYHSTNGGSLEIIFTPIV